MDGSCVATQELSARLYSCSCPCAFGSVRSERVLCFSCRQWCRIFLPLCARFLIYFCTPSVRLIFFFNDVPRPLFLFFVWRRFCIAPPKSELSEEKKSAIVKQVEFYFSDENLPADKFMKSKIKAGGQQGTARLRRGRAVVHGRECCWGWGRGGACGKRLGGVEPTAFSGSGSRLRWRVSVSWAARPGPPVYLPA